MSEENPEQARTTIKCLACGNRADDVEEHHRHMIEAPHPDKGEVWVA